MVARTPIESTSATRSCSVSSFRRPKLGSDPGTEGVDALFLIWDSPGVTGARKPLIWVGSSRADLSRFPAAVKVRMGFTLHLAQLGSRHPDAKPLKGFSGAGVLEIVSDHDGDTFRSVYTVRFERSVYVLHAFQKKSKRGIATPRKELDLIRQRLDRAGRDYAKRRQ